MTSSVITPTKLNYLDDIFYGNAMRKTNINPINKYIYSFSDAEKIQHIDYQEVVN